MLISIRNFGSLLQDQGELEEAEVFYLEPLEIGRRVHGDSHIKTLISKNNCGSLLNMLGQWHDSVKILRDGESAARTLWASDPSLLGNYLTKLGYAQRGTEEYATAETTLLEACLLQKEEATQPSTQRLSVASSTSRICTLPGTAPSRAMAMTPKPMSGGRDSVIQIDRFDCSAGLSEQSIASECKNTIVDGLLNRTNMYYTG